MVVRMKGYLIEDSSDLSRNDFEDAVGGEARTEESECESEYLGFSCTRSRDHHGPHICATGPNTITAIWETAEDAHTHDPSGRTYLSCNACLRAHEQRA